MDTEFSSIPVSMIRQCIFCRRIPFFCLLKGIEPSRGLWVHQGKAEHARVEQLLRRRNLSKVSLKDPYELLTEVSLRSKFLHIHGICDAILKAPNEIIPIELKPSGKRPTSGEMCQLCAYAMILEEGHPSKISKGFVLYGNGRNPSLVEFSENLRKKVTDLLELMRSDIAGGLLPPTSATEAQCSQCEYLNFCGDRL